MPLYTLEWTQQSTCCDNYLYEKCAAVGGHLSTFCAAHFHSQRVKYSVGSGTRLLSKFDTVTPPAPLGLVTKRVCYEVMLMHVNVMLRNLHN